jgi:transposase-like protein
MYTITKDAQGTTEQTTEKKDYRCPFCKAEWTTMEAVDNHGPDGFLCHRCSHVLVETDRDTGGHEQSTRVNDQFQFIRELLPQIDAVHIPECDFDRAFAKARPVVRDETNRVAHTIALDSAANKPMAVKGLANTGPQSISVNISTSEGASEAEKEAEKARREKIAQQNALPAWMSNSTVTGESFSEIPGTGLPSLKQENSAGEDERDRQADSTAIAQIDDIFEKIKAEQAEQRMRQQEQDEDEDEDYGSDEDEDDFEDVPATGNISGFGTPGASGIKREQSGDGDSAAEQQNKRMKIEHEIKRDEAAEDSVEDDDDNLEFEDV